MKYMLIMNTPRDGYTQYLSWPKKDLEANTAFMTPSPESWGPLASWWAAEGLASPAAGEARARRQGRQADHRRRVSRVQGVPRRLLDRGRRQSGAGLADRRGSVDRAGRPVIRGADGALRSKHLSDRSARDHERPAQVTSIVAGPSCRAPAARACAAGAGRGGPAFSRLRRVRGRRAGSADRRGRAVAARRHSGQSARLADPGGAAAHDRPRAQRDLAPEPRGGRGRGNTRRSSRPRLRRAGDRSRRHARPAVHVLSSGAHARLRDRADAARGGRPHDGRDREGVSRARVDDRRSASAAPSRASRPRASLSACPTPRSGRSG